METAAVRKREAGSSAEKFSACPASQGARSSSLRSSAASTEPRPTPTPQKRRLRAALLTASSDAWRIQALGSEAIGLVKLALLHRRTVVRAGWRADLRHTVPATNRQRKTRVRRPPHSVRGLARAFGIFGHPYCTGGRPCQSARGPVDRARDHRSDSTNEASAGTLCPGAGRSRPAAAFHDIVFLQSARPGPGDNNNSQYPDWLIC